MLGDSGGPCYNFPMGLYAQIPKPPKDPPSEPFRKPNGEEPGEPGQPKKTAPGASAVRAALRHSARTAALELSRAVL